MAKDATTKDVCWSWSKECLRSGAVICDPQASTELVPELMAANWGLELQPT